MAAGAPAWRLRRFGSDAVPASPVYGAQPAGVRPIPRPRALLPSPETLDYAHKLTSTTLLLGAAVVFLLVLKRNPARALRGLVNRQVAGLR